MAAHLELGSKELQRFAAPQDCIDNPWTLKFRFQEGSVKVTCWETLKRHNKQRENVSCYECTRRLADTHATWAPNYQLCGYCFSKEHQARRGWKEWVKVPGSSSRACTYCTVSDADSIFLPVLDLCNNCHSAVQATRKEGLRWKNFSRSDTLYTSPVSELPTRADLQQSHWTGPTDRQHSAPPTLRAALGTGHGRSHSPPKFIRPCKANSGLPFRVTGPEDRAEHGFAANGRKLSDQADYLAQACSRSYLNIKSSPTQPSQTDSQTRLGTHARDQRRPRSPPLAVRTSDLADTPPPPFSGRNSAPPTNSRGAETRSSSFDLPPRRHPPSGGQGAQRPPQAAMSNGRIHGRSQSDPLSEQTAYSQSHLARDSLEPLNSVPRQPLAGRSTSFHPPRQQEALPAQALLTRHSAPNVHVCAPEAGYQTGVQKRPGVPEKRADLPSRPVQPQRSENIPPANMQPHLRAGPSRRQHVPHEPALPFRPVATLGCGLPPRPGRERQKRISKTQVVMAGVQVATLVCKVAMLATSVL